MNNIDAAGFSAKQIRDFVKAVKDEAGAGWSMLGRRFQEALIGERALLVLGSQVSDKIETRRIHELRTEMLIAANLYGVQS